MAKVFAQSTLLTSLSQGPSKQIEKSKTSMKMACNISFSDSNYLDDMIRFGRDFRSKIIMPMTICSWRRGRGSRCVTKAVFERFTQQGIESIIHAHEESIRLGHNYIGTGHILFGLTSDPTGIPAKVFASMVIGYEDVRFEVENLIGKGNGFVLGGFAFTPRAKGVFELALLEARELGHNYIGSEHLLLGLLRAGKGVADRVLEKLCVYPSDIRTQVIRMINEGNEVSVVTTELSCNTKMPKVLDGNEINPSELAREVKFEFLQITYSKNEASRSHDFDKFEGSHDQRAIHHGMNKAETVETKVDIQDLLSSWYGIHVEKVLTEESDRLLNMEEVLHELTIAPDDPVKTMMRSIRQAICRARVGLKNPNQPIASFIFSDPTGVGKLELAQTVAAYYFGSEEAIIRLDMSEFTGSRIVSKLIEAVRRQPNIVVLFDELEKANPDVFNMMVQILEDGRLTDSNGRTVDFKNTIMIMTSNVGSSEIEKDGQHIGFDMGFDLDENGNYYRIKSSVREELHEYYSRELLNRVDEVIVFK